jgi:hypothetical protein
MSHIIGGLAQRLRDANTDKDFAKISHNIP